VTRKLVECVPNFSEGRRLDVVAEIEAEIASVAGVTVLDRHADPDHNRSVITFVGPPDGAREAAFRAIRKAAERIDLTAHEGEHPRIGATDVVPFVPLEGVTMADCVRLAEALGAEVGERLGIPVYLYERAARRPERRALPNVRRGEFEALRTEIETNPERAPDFGPPRVHPTAGAVAIGARHFLIAFNVNLASTDLEAARAIAARIRQSSGGLPAVRALGFRLAGRGIVQVSTNLVDYRKTGMGTVFRRVEQLARERGIEVSESEIVGLAPRAALVEAAREALRLRTFERRQVIEERLAELGAGPFDARGFLEDLASARPSPGGGSAAALAGALAAAAAEKVTNLTWTRPRFEPLRDEFRALANSLAMAREDLLRLVERDARAFEGLLKAMRLPRATSGEAAERRDAIEAATLEACRAPLAVAESIATVLRGAAKAAACGNRGVLADAVAAAALGRGALEAARAMLRVNAPGLCDRAAATEIEKRFDAIRAECDGLAQAIEAAFAAELAARAAS
jgi:glutamate formiminotransferase/formiminotetrahydrofolate cyclodeaminase